ncbi:hypothetical protein A3D05_05550 [Candidatus Gottesmanbacteria bacterium RIFCSPHIGHO2_02_FULL_40_24]|uniref:peptidoglycan glycosyltransferase n=1 Tax=Candidatus Gottesmanbacteria bacterium RIFCSPHIGHO2_01_FULL_40_15 TaxID=1798376 RepID=A0A1F5Z7R2_9BACT|nr:MAG: hypothetical protein A2777_02185 [Candidatus Gottesmanbacteria bacterium RIFCSPHIGHO2_01_FULL_40_15]OGG16494.1 MAG: hypothetical protein A3D05_05550 [Candidatus Gottesmanbacteria bacterium RIFCSPHIGHO2_02_FULL_40_24]OGG25607.1 MAG: hypothetical protein A3E42_04700 [Candidatus Gottesmanbacteria bacterium RIFCSPHIGHO2_12_FULL_40_13]
MKKHILPVLILVLLFFYIIPVMSVIYSFDGEFVSKERLTSHNDTGIIIYDVKGRPFFGFGQAKVRRFIPLAKIPSILKEAVLISEDRDFYRHNGVSVKAIARAFFFNITKGYPAYGASTLTQQLTKNVLLNSNKNVWRKLLEIPLSIYLEKKFNKNEILEMYFNTVYFGRGAWGIEAAAETYFDKKTQDLNLAESVLLTSVLPFPSKFKPEDGLDPQIKNRFSAILNELVKSSYITAQVGYEVKNTPVHFVLDRSINRNAPHFALMIKNEIEKNYGPDIVGDGLKVYTTLDLDWQRFAEKIVKIEVEKIKKLNAGNAAVVVLDSNTSAVRVLVGSADWEDNDIGKVNMALSLRQPGSSFKPVVYLLGLSRGNITLTTKLKDVPTAYTTPAGIYKPHNYDRKFRGPVSVRRALSNSLNVPAVELISRIGVENVLDFARLLGISSLEDKKNYGLSLVLGTGEVSLLELTGAYSVIANNGLKNTPYIIEKIISKQNEIIYKHKNLPENVVDRQSVFLLTSILSDRLVRREVFGKILDTKTNAAVKTGTTDNFKDSWTIGFTPQISVGVWVGNNYGQPMANLPGSRGAAPIWKILIDYYSQFVNHSDFVAPEGIVKLKVCKSAGAAGSTEYFVSNLIPKSNC